MGIGGDTSVEQEFKGRYPECKFYGIEASEGQFGQFERLGTPITLGVGVESGEFPLILRAERNSEGENSYYEKNVTVHPLPQILDKYIKQRLVHFTTIGLEGFEYSILEELFNNRGNLSGQGIVFCQISAELHQYKEKHVSAFQKLIQTVSEHESDYLPVRYSRHMKLHHTVTFINFGNRECRRAFDFQKLFK